MNHLYSLLLCATLTIVVSGFPIDASGADTTTQASGKFTGKKLEFEAQGAYAFSGKVGLSDEPGILVAVSNVSFNPSSLDVIWDRRYMIDTYFRDDETLVVYFQFSNSGKYQGMSYHFTSGDSCSYCYDGTVQSNVKIAGGRVKGRIQQATQKDEVYFDITIDVPLATSDYGKLLPADGGEPGKVYADLHLALQGSDPAALKPIIVERLVSKLANSGDDVLAVLQDEHPLKSYKIIKGFVKGDRVLLIVEGSNSTIKIKTEAHLMREQGKWRFDNEIMQLRFDE